MFVEHVLLELLNMLEQFLIGISSSVLVSLEIAKQLIIHIGQIFNVSPASEPLSSLYLFEGINVVREIIVVQVLVVTE